jgi:hypothetical protein
VVLAVGVCLWQKLGSSSEVEGITLSKEQVSQTTTPFPGLEFSNPVEEGHQESLYQEHQESLQ